MSDTKPEPYVEDPDFVPDPTDAVATLDTSGTAGAAHGKIEEVSAIFDVARQQDLATAARALDDDDDTVDASLVTLPTGSTIVNEDPAAAADRVRAKASAVGDHPVDLSSSRFTSVKEEAASSGDSEADNAPAGATTVKDMEATTSSGNIDTSSKTSDGPKSSTTKGITKK